MTEERGRQSTSPEGPAVNRRASAAWNALFGYATIGIALIRNIVLVPVYLHFIPVDEFGVWMASGGALVNLFIVDFGLSGALTQRVSQFLGAGEFDRLGRALVAGLVASALLAGILTATALLLAPLVPLFSELSPAAAARAVQCFRIAILTGGIGILNAALLGLLRSFHRPAAAGLTNVTADLISIAVTLVLLGNHYGMYSLADGLLSRSGFVLCASFLVLRSEIRRRTMVVLELAGREFRVLLGGSLYWFTASISMKLQTNANTVIVASSLGPTAAAAYGLTVRAHETLQALLLELAHAVTPSMAHLFGEGNVARLRDVSMRLVVVIAALAAVGMAVAVACDPMFVSLWVGRGLYAGHLVSALMALSIWIGLIGHVGYDAVQARGDFRAIAGIYSLTAAVHILALFALTRFGVWGAPAASVASASLLALLFWRKVDSVMPIPIAERGTLVRCVSSIAVVGVAIAVGGLYALPSMTDHWVAFIGRATFLVLAGIAGLYVAAPDVVNLFRAEVRTTLGRRAR